MSSGEDIAAGASFSDGGGRQHGGGHARKGHRKSIMHANLAESLKIRQASSFASQSVNVIICALPFSCYA